METRDDMLVRPKTIYWIEMPKALGEDEHIELLKRDMLIINYSGNYDDIKVLEKEENENTAFFYNLDKILLKNNIYNPQDMNSFVPNIIQFVKNFAPKRSLIHTNVINPLLTRLAKKEGVLYLEKNLEDKKNALSTAFNIIPPFFTKGGQIRRAFLRLNLYHMRHDVELLNKNRGQRIIKATLKDLSLNGIGIILKDKADFNHIKLKDQFKLKIYMKPKFINITTAFLTRIDDETQSIGINFDINNTSMVKPVDADNITKMIYKWVKEILYNKKK